MNVDRGAIRIETSNDSKVRIEVLRELKRGSRKEAEEIFQAHTIEMSQAGETVQVTAQNKKNGGLFGRDPFRNLRVEYNISIPEKFNLNLRTAGGEIEIPDLEGDVQARTAGGHINIGKVDGGIMANTSGGSVTVAGGSQYARLRTSGGHIRIGNLAGSLEANTSGGSITVGEVKGAIQAETSGGHIEIEGAGGGIVARTSGGSISAHMASQPSSDCMLRTSGGHVRLTVADELALNIKASTSGGRIETDFPGDMNKQGTRLAAQIRGGGPEVALHTSGGNVEIRKD